MKVYWLKNSDTYHKKGCSHIEGRTDLISGDVEDALIADKKPCRECFKRDMQSVHNAVLMADGVVYNSSLRKYDQIRWVYYRFPKEFQKTVLLYRHLKKTLDDETADNDLLQFFRTHSYTSLSDDSFKCMEAYFGVMNKPIVHDVAWFNEQLKSVSAGQKPAKQDLTVRNSQPPVRKSGNAVIDAEYTVKQASPKQQARIYQEPVNSNAAANHETKSNKFVHGLETIITGTFKFIGSLIVVCFAPYIVVGPILLVVYLFNAVIDPEPSTPAQVPRQQETSSVKQKTEYEPKIYTSRIYNVYCEIDVVDSNSVGNEWYYDYLNIQVNGVDMGGTGITLHEGDYIYPNVLVYEYDAGGSDSNWANPESGFYITANHLQSGFSYKVTGIIVTEDHSRYAGNEAIVDVIFNFAPQN